MEDRALYQTILGVSEPWTVGRVELREPEQAVHVFVEAMAGTAFTCPDCGATDCLRAGRGRAGDLIKRAAHTELSVWVAALTRA